MSRRPVQVATRSTWEAALEEANRRVLLCREKFGPGDPHRWRLRITRRRVRRSGERPWVITFHGGL